VKIPAPETQAFIKAFCELYDKHNKELIINFEPQYFDHKIEEGDVLWTPPPCRYFVTGDMHFPKDMWADRGHLNRKGIEVYQGLFLNRLSQTLERNP